MTYDWGAFVRLVRSMREAREAFLKKPWGKAEEELAKELEKKVDRELRKAAVAANPTQGELF